MPRTLVVGDVHGCLDELRDLLRVAGYGKGDRLVFVGDLVRKGPDSQGVVMLAREAGALAVLGNHDVHTLRARDHLAAGEEAGLSVQDVALVRAFGAADWRYLEALPVILRLGPGREGMPDTAVIHAGAVPGVPLERQKREHLFTMRSIAADGSPSKRVEGSPWAALWTGPERIVFGHDAIRKLQQHQMAVGLDTGCVYGERLTAIWLPEDDLVSVPARRAYVAAGLA